MSTFLTATTKRQVSRSASTAKKFGPGQELVNCGSAVSGGQRRGVSDYGHFYRNRQLELYATKEARRLTLRQLVRTFFNPLGSSRSLQPKINGVLGLVRAFYDSRQADQSEGAPHHQLVSPTVFLIPAPHSERELCTDGAANPDLTSSAGPASVAVCRRKEGRGRQSLRGTYSPCPLLSLTRTRFLMAHTFFSYIGQLSKSEEERFVWSRPPSLIKPCRLRKYPSIETLEDNGAFCAFLREILDEQ